MSHHPGPDDPDHHRPDEAYDRLRSADPAARLTPDAATLDAAVRARVGDVLGDPEHAGHPAVAAAAVSGGSDGRRAAGDELAAARARRRPSRWLAVAAVTAGTIAVGSAGYALGDRADGDLTASGATSAITLPQPGAAPQGAAGAAGTRSAESLAADSAASMPWFGGRTVFTAQGLSDAPGTAEAWAYDPTASYSADTAARAAGVLGLEGEPRLEGATWVVGPVDGSGPSLQLQPDGTTSVSYYDPTRDPFGCPVPLPEPEPDAPAEGGGSDGSAGAAVECTPPDLGPAPRGDAAVAAARELVAGLGADPDAFEYEVGDAGSEPASYVTAYSVLGGQRTGLLWSMTLVGDGVQSVYGFLAPVVPLGTYDVISPDAAVDRLSDPRFGTFGGPVMAVADDAAAVREPAVDPAGPATSAEAPVDGPAVPSAPPAAVTPGSRFAWPVTDVVLTSSRLGLAQHTQPDGATVLLPTYELSSADGATWSVVAVADAALDFAPVP